MSCINDVKRTKLKGLGYLGNIMKQKKLSGKPSAVEVLLAGTTNVAGAAIKVVVVAG